MFKPLVLFIFALMPALISTGYALPLNISNTGHATNANLLPPEVTPVLTLKEAILLAMRMNPDVHNAELQRVVDKFAVAVARNQFYPQLSLSGQALYQNGGKPAYGALPGVTWATPLGSTISTAITQTLNNNINPPISSGAQLTITQPLLRGFGPAVAQATQHNVMDNEKNNQLTFKSQVINVVVAVVATYYQLVQAHNDLKVNQLQLKDAQTTLSQTLAKVKVGKAAPADEIQQQAQIAELQLAIASNQNNIEQANQNLLNLLGLDPNAHIKINETITATYPPIPDLPQSITQALANNINYQQALNTFRVSQRALVTAKDAQKWDLTAALNLNQRLSQNTGDVPALSKSLTLNLNIPVHDMPRKQQLVNAKIALEQAKTNLDQLKRRLVTDVTNAYNNLQFSRRQIALYKNSIRLAQQSLAIARIKFNYGKAAPFELVTLQTNLTQTQLSSITQQIYYLTAVESFYQLLGTTLNKWQLTLSY